MRVALTVLLVAGLTACGGSPGGHGTSKKDYEQRMAALVPPVQGEVLKGRFALEAVRIPKRAEIRLAHLDAELKATIAGLRAITPPADVANEHAALIDAYDALLARFEALMPLARQTTTDKLRVQAGELASAPALQEIGDELRAIIAKGYDLGFPPGS